jgi:hypothetical protein
MGSFRNPCTRGFATKPRLQLTARVFRAFSVASFGFVFSPALRWVRFALSRKRYGLVMGRRFGFVLPNREKPGHFGALWGILGHRIAPSPRRRTPRVVGWKGWGEGVNTVLEWVRFCQHASRIRSSSERLTPHPNPLPLRAEGTRQNTPLRSVRGACAFDAREKRHERPTPGRACA